MIIEFKHLLIRQNTEIASLTGDSDRAGGCTPTQGKPLHTSLIAYSAVLHPCDWVAYAGRYGWLNWKRDDLTESKATNTRVSIKLCDEIFVPPAESDVPDFHRRRC